MAQALTIGVFATCLAGGPDVVKRVNELLTAEVDDAFAEIYGEGCDDDYVDDDEFAVPLIDRCDDGGPHAYVSQCGNVTCIWCGKRA